MPKKKGPTQISMRLKPAELEPLDEDRKALPGVPVSRNTYAKHAVLSFPLLRQEVDKLRKLEVEVRKQANGGEEMVCDIANDFLREAGL